MGLIFGQGKKKGLQKDELARERRPLGAAPASKLCGNICSRVEKPPGSVKFAGPFARPFSFPWIPVRAGSLIFFQDKE